MKTSKQYVTALNSAHHKVRRLQNEFNEKITRHLGEGWFVTYDYGDGVLLCSPDAGNYRIETYLATVNMPRDQAIAYIRARDFN